MSPHNCGDASHSASLPPDHRLYLLNAEVIDAPRGLQRPKCATFAAESPRRGPALGDDDVVRPHMEVVVSDPPIRPWFPFKRVWSGSFAVAPGHRVRAFGDDFQWTEHGGVRVGASDFASRL